MQEEIVARTTPVHADAGYMPASEVCKRISVTRSTLSYWRAKGTGPLSVKIGGSVRYPVEAFEAWLVTETAATARGGVA